VERFRLLQNVMERVSGVRNSAAFEEKPIAPLVLDTQLRGQFARNSPITQPTVKMQWIEVVLQATPECYSRSMNKFCLAHVRNNATILWTGYTSEPFQPQLEQ